MRRVTRIDRSIGLLRPSGNLRPSSICAVHHGAPTFSTSISRNAQDQPFTERIRRRMWGTDNPPGQKDPYARAGTVQAKPPQQTIQAKLPAKYIAPKFSPATLMLSPEEFSEQERSSIEQQLDASWQHVKTRGAVASDEESFRNDLRQQLDTNHEKDLQVFIEQRAAYIEKIINTKRFRSHQKVQRKSKQALLDLEAPPLQVPVFELWESQERAYIDEKVEEIWEFLKSQGASDSQELGAKSKLRGFFENEYRVKKSRRALESFGPVGNGVMEVSEPRELFYEVPSGSEESYEAAETYDGLEEIGEPIVPYFRYTGFMRHNTINTDLVNEALLHRAMVEVFVVQAAGLPLSTVSKNFPIQPTDEVLTDSVNMFPSSTGVRLEFKGNASQGNILKSLTDPNASIALPKTTEESNHIESEEDAELIDETGEKVAPTESEEDVAADRFTVDPLKDNSPVSKDTLEAWANISASWDPAWLEVSLENPEIKFAVMKRVMQLTGKRVSDAHLRSIKTAASLRTLLLTPPKPTKLVESLEDSEDLITLPNVSVHPERQSYIHKEIALGRWKVIQKELEARDLPIMGEDSPLNFRGPKADRV